MWNSASTYRPVASYFIAEEGNTGNTFPILYYGLQYR